MRHAIYALSLGLLWWVDWRVAVGVLLFGWAMNLENFPRHF